MIKDATLTAIYGMRGSGKTTRAGILTRDCHRLIVFDPRREYELARPSWSGLIDHVRQNWGAGFRVAYTPNDNFEKEALHELCRVIMFMQAPYEAGDDTRQVTLVVEEMDLSYPAAALPQELFGMARVCNQGRHFGINVIGITQRPALVSMNYRGNCAETYIYPLAWHSDREPVLAMLGRDHREGLAALRPHQYIVYRDGEVSTGENPPIGQSTT